MSRYETFLVRLWIGDENDISHGEVKHLGSGNASRFRDLSNSTSFIEETMKKRIAAERKSQEESQEDSLLDFGRMASR